MTLSLTPRERRGLWTAIALLVTVRLVTLGVYPVMDSTESRYAEIARKMLETGNWLTPQIAYGVPFWGKPPLSTWLSAMSMAAFGVNEFAARLPSLLLMVGCGALVFMLGRFRAGRDAALLASAFFATTGLVFIAGGAVMTDETLALGTTLSMVGFWIAVHGSPQRRRVAGLAFFAGLAVGMMAKGPIALVLTFLPVGAWTLWTKSWRAVWERLPWIAGTLLAALIATPWYLAAERATPGFLDYFIVGEHWKRFVEPGWKGDLYGSGHARPRGTIWFFWIAAALPWSVPAIGWLGRAAASRRDALGTLVRDPWQAYLLLWTIAPMLFFMLSRNILATYVLPGIPAFALLLATLWRTQDADARAVRSPIRQAIAAGVLVPLAFAGTILAMRPQFSTQLSQRALVREYESRRADETERLIYVTREPISAEFYSHGQAVLVPDAAGLAPYLADGHADFIVIRGRDAEAASLAQRAQLRPIGEFGGYRLLQESRAIDATRIPQASSPPAAR
jgi:4-amino-4-deoxy-L-arabinose transferase-like glycosyltransferase